MNKLRLTILFVIWNLASCSLHPLGHSKNGRYMGMTGSTQGMTRSSFVPKQVQRQEPIF